MRKDMGRLVIERERSGSGNPSLKVKRVGRLVTADDGVIEYEGPAKVPNSAVRMRAIHRKLQEKGFTDVLSPLNGYLRSKLGEPWDGVYSELSRNLGAFSWPLEHIMRFHLDVVTNTYLGVDGKVYGTIGRHGGAYHCVSEPSSYPDFYVHPVTGRLQIAQRISQRWHRPRTAGVRVSAGGDKWYVLINGNWFIGRYRKHPYLGVEYVSRWRSQYPEMEWPHYRVAYGAKEDVGSFLFEVIKSANKKECAEARAKVKKEDAEWKKQKQQGRKRG